MVLGTYARAGRALCVTCLASVGKLRPTVLRAVVCGPCWAAHGGSPDAAEIGPTPLEAVSSCDPTDQKQWLTALRRQPWVQTVRADGQRNLLKVARLVALYAQWDTLETRPTWAKLIARSGVSERTVARWLQELRVRGWLAHLERGSTPATRPMSLAGLVGNRAARYGLRIPLTPEEALLRSGEQLVAALVRMLDGPDVPPQPSSPGPETVAEQATPAEPGDTNGTLPWSVQVFPSSSASGPSRASEPVDKSSSSEPDPTINQRTALRADSDRGKQPDSSIMVPVSGYQMLVAADGLRRRLPVFARCSRLLVRALCRPYWRAGWCNRDIVHAMDHRPSVFDQPTGVLLCPDHVTSPAQFIRSRLQAWRAPDSTILSGHWTSRVADAATVRAARRAMTERHGRAGARLLLSSGDRALRVEHITAHGQACRPRASVDTPSAIERRRRDRDYRRAQLVAEARAHLAQSAPADNTEPPTASASRSPSATPAARHDHRYAPAAAGGSVYDRALARARAERGTGRPRYSRRRSWR